MLMLKHKQQHQITQAITHIPLCHTNSCKRAALDELAEVYQDLCQDYTIYFCEVEAPNKYADPPSTQHPLAALATGRHATSGRYCPIVAY